MVFSGIVFLYYFLPFVLLLYFFAPKRAKNTVLLLSSLLFYAWGEPRFLILMVFTIAFGYLAGVWIEKEKTKENGTYGAKRILILSIAVFAGLFVYFKYTNFIIGNINAVTGANLPLRHIVLPIGISFYTFQIISYLVDVYRGTVKAQKNIIALALYIAMFPQLIAGPIVRYQDVETQILERRHTWEDIGYGITRFTIGLSKKVLIANELGRLCELYRQSTEPSICFAWLYAIAFMLHIYFDFSGYSDMAIGLGRIFGFTFPENFKYPYIAGSITEFWRRWHMSLGAWFRDYVYIPLGGNRVSTAKWYRNILIVWLFTGFWHGAEWTFVVWGLGFAVLLILEKNGLLIYLEKFGFLRHVYVLLLLLIGFVIFNADNMSVSMSDIQNLFGFGGIVFYSKETGYYAKSFGLLILIGMVGSTPMVATLVQKTVKKFPVIAKGKVFVLLLLWILCTTYLVDGSFNPFLYFRF